MRNGVLFVIGLMMFLTVFPNKVNAASVGSGDSNSDGQVNSNDLKTVLFDFGKSLGLPVDQYTDGKINGFDFVTVLKRIGENNPPIGGNPYGGVPWTVPGVIQAENYDLGEEGNGYHDLTATNEGGAYRTDGVDVVVSPDESSGSFDVSTTKVGEWLKYTINVVTPGTYDILVRVNLVDYATSPGQFHLEIDGVDVSGTMTTVRGYGQWQGYYTVIKKNVTLTSGIHQMKLVMDSTNSIGEVGNFNWIAFKLISPEPQFEFLTIPQPGTQVFYVSPNGNDINPGTQSLPWKTLAKAAVSATAGQTVYLRAGIYNERLVPQNSGNPGNYIIFSGYPGEEATIDGIGLTYPKYEGLVSINDKKYIRVANLKVTNAGVNVPDGTYHMGIVSRNSDHIVIDHNFISHMYSVGIGVEFFSQYVLVDSNEITDTNFGSTDDSTALRIGWFSNNVEIVNNIVHHMKNEGINPVAGAHDVKIHGNSVHDSMTAKCRIGFYIDAWTEHQYDIDVYNNTAFNNCGEGITVSSEGGGLLENINMFNNVVYGNKGAGGIAVAKWSTTPSLSHPIHNVNIVNNTLHGNINGGVFVNNVEAQNILIRNNIIYNNATPIVIDSQVPPSVITQDHNLTTNPNFVNVVNNDFHITSNSSAIDQGSSIGAPGFDYDNKVRPKGSGFDIGAFEF